MTSQKQIDANRANALKSTGPSEKGKARSRLNAIRDNLTGQIITLSNEDRPIFEKFKADHVADLAPKTLQEQKLAHAIAWDTWRLDHLRAIEMNVYALAAEEMEQSTEEEISDADPDALDIALSDARTFRAEAKRFELMSLYEQRMSKTLHRNLATLRDLQTERKRNYESDKHDEILIARLHEFNELPIKASRRPSKNGFVFSDEEIAIGAVRQRYVDTAANLIRNTDFRQLNGNLVLGCGDTFLQKHSDDIPVEKPGAINHDHPSLEDLTIRRQTNPEEFGLRTEPRQ